MVVEHVGASVRRAGRDPPPRRRPAGACARAIPPRSSCREAERGTATWVFEHEQAGRAAARIRSPGGEWLHVPLATVRGAGRACWRSSIRRRPPPGCRWSNASCSRRWPGRRRWRSSARASTPSSRRRRSSRRSSRASRTGSWCSNHDGVVQHVNEVACAILGFERARRSASASSTSARAIRTTCGCARRSPSSSPIPSASTSRSSWRSILRGRDHYYMLRPTPLRARDGTHAGLILVLQDVTYLRDQEARREQLMATLSHELRTPLTSLRMARRPPRPRAAGRSTRSRARLVEAAREDVAAPRRRRATPARRLALARHEHRARAPATCIWASIATRCARIFALQARERGVRLETRRARTRICASPATRPRSPGRSPT